MATQEANGQMRKSIKVPIPTDRYPQYNFVGRLLGPRGSTLKQMQRDTQTWIRIRGRGSMRDKQEEARIRNQPGHEHLLEPLHVHIEARGDQNMIDHLLSNAEQVVKGLLVPVEESKDVHKKEQLRQLAQVRAQEQMGGGAYMDPTGQAAAAAAADPYGMYAAYYNNPYSGYYAAYYQQAAAGGANPYQYQQQQQAWGTPAAAPTQQTSTTPSTTPTTSTSSTAPATNNLTAAVDAAAAAAAAGGGGATTTTASAAPSSSDNKVEDYKKQLAEIQAERKLLEGLLEGKDGGGGLAEKAPHTNRLLSAYEERLSISAGQDDVKMTTTAPTPAQATTETATANLAATATAEAQQSMMQGPTSGDGAATSTSASGSSGSVAAAAILTPTPISTTTTNTTSAPAPPGTVAPPPPGTAAAATATDGDTNGMIGADIAFVHPSRAAMVTEGRNGSNNTDGAHKSGGPIRTERGTNRYTPY